MNVKKLLRFFYNINLWLCLDWTFYIWFKYLFFFLENQLLSRPKISARPHIPEEVTIRQKPRITINTSPGTIYQLQTESNLPATTYRPAIQFFTQKPSSITYPKAQDLLTNKPSYFDTSRKPVDFASELKKFNQQHIITSTTPSPKTTNFKTYRPQTTVQKFELPSATLNPIYETQLVFDPSTGQIDSSLFPQNVAYSIPTNLISTQHQPYHSSTQIVSLEQLQQQNQPLHQRQASTPRSPLQLQQFSQQVIFC